MHYTSKEKALEKWNARAKRVVKDNLFVLFSDGEEFNESHLERYARLPYRNKLFFSAKPRHSFGGTVFIRDYSKAPYVFDVTRNRKYEKYVDLTKWLNGEASFSKG